MAGEVGERNGGLQDLGQGGSAGAVSLSVGTTAAAFT